MKRFGCVFVMLCTLFAGVAVAEEPKEAPAPAKAAEPAKLDDATWQSIRATTAELQLLEERHGRLVSQAEIARRQFLDKRGAWSQEVAEAAKRAGVDQAKCLPDPATRTWAPVNGHTGSCLAPAPEKKPAETKPEGK